MSKIVVFNNISLDKIQTGYTLKAGATGLDSATSATFNITAGAATRLAFTTEPGNTTAGVAITPAVQVTVYDAGGNVTNMTDTVTMAILNNAGGGTLSGTLKRVPDGSGVATFTGLNINKVGTGYTLRATSGSLQSDTSAGFNISAAAAHHLAFAIQPSVTASGDAITPAPTAIGSSSTPGRAVAVRANLRRSGVREGSAPSRRAAAPATRRILRPSAGSSMRSRTASPLGTCEGGSRLTIVSAPPLRESERARKRKRDWGSRAVAGASGRLARAARCEPES